MARIIDMEPTTIQCVLPGDNFKYITDLTTPKLPYDIKKGKYLRAVPGEIPSAAHYNQLLDLLIDLRKKLGALSYD